MKLTILIVLIMSLTSCTFSFGTKAIRESIERDKAEEKADQIERNKKQVTFCKSLCAPLRVIFIVPTDYRCICEVEQ